MISSIFMDESLAFSVSSMLSPDFMDEMGFYELRPGAIDADRIQKQVAIDLL